MTPQRVILAMTATLMAACLVWAQPGLGRGRDRDGFPREVKDPTSPSQKLKDIMNAGKIAAQPALLPKVSTLVLRGRVLVKNQPPAAVVEVDGRTHTVGKGSPIPGGVYRVVDITSTEVHLENLLIKETVVLR